MKIKSLNTPSCKNLKTELKKTQQNLKTAFGMLQYNILLYVLNQLLYKLINATEWKTFNGPLWVNVDRSAL